VWKTVFRSRAAAGLGLITADLFAYVTDSVCVHRQTTKTALSVLIAPRSLPPAALMTLLNSSEVLSELVRRSHLAERYLADPSRIGNDKDSQPQSRDTGNSQELADRRSEGYETSIHGVS
jgi:hypothetical protein